MKKIISVILVIALAAALLIGCNNNNGAQPESSPAAPADSPAAAPAESPAAAPAESPSAAPAESPAASSAGAASDAPAQPDSGGWDFSDANKVNLTYAIYLAESDATAIDTARYFDMIKEYTEGTVDYTMYAGQSLVNGDEELDAVRNGLADVTFFPVAYGSGQMPVGYILEYPGVAFNNGVAASYTFRDWFNQLNLPELSDFHLLYAIGQGNGCFMTTFEVNSFADLKGKQIRCGAALTPIFDAYGIFPTVMVFSEVYEALRTGVVQGFYGMQHAGNSAKLQEVTSYVTIDPYYIGGYIMVMNKDVWASLTADQQAAIEAATEDAFVEFLAVGRDVDAALALEIFRDEGLTIVNLSDEDLAEMGRANGPIQEAYASSVQGGMEALELYRELAAKYNAMYP